MKKNILIIGISIILFNLYHISVIAKNSYFEDGKKLFENKNYKDSKFFFEKDIVFNPKNVESYLYLAKVFKSEKKDELQENNLNTVLLLNPKNEEAIYLLTLLEIEKSNFSKAKDLIYKLDSVCEKFCASKKELEEKLNNSLSK
jgi:hypothetical protein